MTYEEITKNYPVGKILYKENEEIKFKRFYYTQKDLECFKETYKEVKILSDNVCLCTDLRSDMVRVEGWLFDGKEWMPAYDTWDGWIPYSKENLEEYNE